MALGAYALLCAAILLLCKLAVAQDGYTGYKNPVKDQLLYIWTGDDDRANPDFIAIFDFNRNGSSYGHLVNVVPLTGTSAYGNEPHHLTFNWRYDRVAAAGILSFLFPLYPRTPLQQQVFIFDTTNPRSPFQINTANPPLSGAADELYPVQKTGGFLLSSLSTRAGTAIGRITELDYNGNILTCPLPLGPLSLLLPSIIPCEYPLLPPLTLTDFSGLNGFVGGVIGAIGGPTTQNTADLLAADGILSLGTLNIHGLAVREDIDLLISTDFIEPASALVATQAVYNGIRYQPTARLWKYSTRTLIDTWVLDQNAGNLVVHFIPNDPWGRAILSGVHSNKLYLLDPNINKTAPGISWYTALDFTAAGYPNADPHYFILGADKKTGFVTLNAIDKIVYFDYSNPYAIKIVQVYSLPTGSNPHYLAFYPGGLGGTQSPYDNRFVLINYFLDFGSFGIIHRGGTKTVDVYQWNSTQLYKDPNWKTLDFKTYFGNTTGAARPHGTTYYYNV